MFESEPALRVPSDAPDPCLMFETDSALGEPSDAPDPCLMFRGFPLPYSSTVCSGRISGQ